MAELPSASVKERTRTTAAWCLLLLFIHGTLLFVAGSRDFVTRNEVAHLPAGVSHWAPGGFALYSVNPPTWRMVAVAPVFLLSPSTESIVFPVDPGDRTEGISARAFAREHVADYWSMIRLSRILGITWSLLCGLLVYAWSRELFGTSAGLLGLTLWCFDPNIVGHAHLLTPDLPLTLAMFGSTYLFWKHVRHPTWEGAVFSGVALGVAQLTKFTALLLYAVWPVLWITALIIGGSRADSRSGRRAWLSVVAQMMLIATTSIAVINGGYGFDSCFRPLDSFRFVSKSLRVEKEQNARWGNRFQDTWVGEIPVPLPAEYVQGIDLQHHDFELGWKSYLRGEIRNRGWWYYYLYAFLVKVPLGTIALLFWAAWLSLFRRANSTVLNGLWLWLPPLVIFTFVSSQTGFNHHFRYVLPIFPFLFVAVSGFGCYFQPFRWRMAVPVLVLLAWSVVSSLSVFPHSLSYFNELAGGPNNGHYHLIDSNIDWGQDLWFLKDWVEENPDARPFALAYYNFIDHKTITGMDYPEPPRDPPENREGASAKWLQSVGPHPGYFGADIHNLKLGGYSYFERFKPIAKAGYSIFIYHITPDEADAARREMGLPPLAAAKEGTGPP